MITGDEMYAVPRRYLGYALSCLRVPYCGIGNSGNASAAEKRVLALYPCYLGKYPFRSPSHAYIRLVGTAVQLEDT